MTAIAAVIALSSTPLFAQSADVPVVETPPPVIEAPQAPIVADDPLAPEPTAEPTTAADPLAAAPAEKPAARKATTAISTAARSRPAPTRVARAAPATATAPVAASPAPAEVTPAVPVLPVQEVPPVAAPVEPAPSPAETALAMDETMLAAGAGGLALLALAGTGLAIRRRRRRAAEAEDAAWQYEAENTAAALTPAETDAPARIVEPKPGYMPEQAEPAFVRAFADAPAATPVVAPVVATEPSAEVEGPVTALPEGFDLSRFGAHVQAAYKGPTEDNPSLSLKYRLRRATAMDQMARKNEAEPVTASAAQPTSPQHDKVDFMLARSGKKPGARPATITNGRPIFSN